MPLRGTIYRARARTKYRVHTIRTCAYNTHFIEVGDVIFFLDALHNLLFIAKMILFQKADYCQSYEQPRSGVMS